MNIVVASTALKHGIDRIDIVHAYENPILVHTLNENLIMVVGGDTAGRLLEVAFVENGSRETVIIHAMKARSKYLNTKRPK